jgi:conjugal transfer pilus assembly protein TraV
MKKILLINVLGGAFLLAGCAGTNSDFECNATTSDSCMTIEEANEKAKLREEKSGKLDVTALPVLGEGDFSKANVERIMPIKSSEPGQKAISSALVGKSNSPMNTAVKPTAKTEIGCAEKGCWSVEKNRPTRIGERTAELWIAPWIDTEDVYHQESNVFFVVSSSAWGKPRPAN